MLTKGRFGATLTDRLQADYFNTIIENNPYLCFTTGTVFPAPARTPKKVLITEVLTGFKESCCR